MTNEDVIQIPLEKLIKIITNDITIKLMSNVIGISAKINDLPANLDNVESLHIRTSAGVIVHKELEPLMKELRSYNDMTVEEIINHILNKGE